jgi:N6-L-threonylcarbamoyladenine synthase
VNSFKLLATTADESIGRSFDKVSKLLQLKWTKLGPGDALEKFCAEDSEGKCPSIPPLPRPMPKRLAFSYSALHSHVKLFIESLGGSESLDIPMKKSIARAFQTAAVGHLEDKLVLALEWCKHQNIDIQSIVVSGGVASNMFLRQRYVFIFWYPYLTHCSHAFSLRERLIEYDKETPYSLIFPPPYLCTGQITR